MPRGAHCTHSRLTNPFTLGECRVWAGGLREAEPKLATCQFALSLLGSEPLTKVRVRQRETVTGRWLSWPNGGAPNVGVLYWVQTVQQLKKIKGDAVVFCHGGHGRTGTALAIIAWLAGLTGDQDPVAWIRKRHCGESVETQAQIHYLRELGIQTTAEPTMADAAILFPKL